MSRVAWSCRHLNHPRYKPHIENAAFGSQPQNELGSGEYIDFHQHNLRQAFERLAVNAMLMAKITIVSTMHILRNAINAQVWAIVILITFATQAMGASEYSAVAGGGKLPEKSEQCHDNMLHDRSPSAEDKNSGSGIDRDSGCCDGGCSMTSCHSTSGITATFKTFAFVQIATHRFFASPDAPSESSSSLYRPPILG